MVAAAPKPPLAIHPHSKLWGILADFYKNLIGIDVYFRQSLHHILKIFTLTSTSSITVTADIRLVLTFSGYLSHTHVIDAANDGPHNIVLQSLPCIYSSELNDGIPSPFVATPAID